MSENGVIGVILHCEFEFNVRLSLSVCNLKLANQERKGQSTPRGNIRAWYTFWITREKREQWYQRGFWEIWQREKLPPCYHWFVSLSVPLSAHYPEGKQWSRTDIFSRGQLAISYPELRNFSVSLIWRPVCSDQRIVDNKSIDIARSFRKNRQKWESLRH
mgnify:CR=1 FL=1